MLLKQNLSLYRLFKITWKIDVMMLGLCTAAYLIDTRLLPDVHMFATLPTLMGTAIAFFVAFNNNQAYDRWWEARTIWGGIVNDSRSWSRNILAYGENDDNGYKRKMILRHIGFVYALKASLRRDNDDAYKHYLTPDDVNKVASSVNIPNAILELQSQDLQQLTKQNKIDGFRFLALNDMIVNFCDGMGKSERINNTVFPTTYIFFTRLFIWLLIILVTMTASEQLGLWAIFFGWMIGFVFYTTHTNGLSIMNPFEPTPASVPLNSITRSIEINLLQMLDEKKLPPPEPTIRDGEYIL